MKTATHYRFTPIGALSIPFYRKRNILRDTTPLIATRWQDVVRCFKGEGAMVEAGEAGDRPHTPGSMSTRGPARRQGKRAIGRHAHA